MSPVETTSLTGKTSLRLDVIDSRPGFADLADRWDALIEIALDGHAQLKSPWLLAWLDHFPPAELAILMVYDTTSPNDDRLIAGLPLELVSDSRGVFARGVKTLTVCGNATDMLDWCDLAVHPEYLSQQGEIVKLLADWMSAQRDWDLLELPLMPKTPKANLLQALQTALKTRLPGAIFEPLDIDIMPAVGKLHYQEQVRPTRALRRRYKSLESKYPSLAVQMHRHHVYDPGFQESFERFVSLHTAYWQAKDGKSLFERFPQATAFYDTILRQLQDGAVWTELRIGDQPVSYSLTLCGSTFALPVLIANDPGFEKDGVGIIHCDQVIRHVLNQPSVRGVLLGRGNHGYKQTWADRAITLQTLRLFRSNLVKTRCQWDDGLKGLKQRLGR